MPPGGAWACLGPRSLAVALLKDGIWRAALAGLRDESVVDMMPCRAVFVFT